MTKQVKPTQKKEQPIQVSSMEHQSSCVYFSEDEKHLPIMSWVEVDTLGEKQFYFARFDQESQTFDSKKQIPIEQNASIHEEGMPKLTVKGDGSFFAMYETSTPVEGSKWGLGALRYIRSFDHGKTWTKPKSVAAADLAKGQSSSFANVVRLADGEIGITWLGTTDPDLQEKYKGRPIKFTKTEGNALKEPQLIDPEGCECCRTALSSSPEGQVFLTYRNLLPGSIRDISYVSSDDNGENFKKINSFSEDQWKINGCPHNGPSVQNIGGKAFVAWFTGSEKHSGVNLAELDSVGSVVNRYNLSESGRFAQVSQVGGHPIVAYSEDIRVNDSIFTRIVLKKIQEDKIFQKEVTPEHVEAEFPMVFGLPNQDIVVSWSQDDQVFYRLVKTDELELSVEDLMKVAQAE